MTLTTFLANTAILSSHIGMVVGTYLDFYTSTINGRWHNLWANLHEIQQDLNLDETFHQRCLIGCCASLIALIAVHANSYDPIQELQP